MVDIAVYTYSIEILTPLIITMPSGYRGMSYTIVSNYILGSSVRGAVFSSLINEKLIDVQKAREESINPLHSVTPALYTLDSKSILYKDVTFAHSLTYVFKTGGEVYSLGIENLLKYIDKEFDVDKALHKLLLDFIQHVDKLCYKKNNVFRSSADTKKILSEILLRRDKKWIRVKPRTSIYVENVVDRVRKSSAEGILYAYEYIEPGSIFVGCIAVDKKSRIYEAMNSINKSSMIIRIGRGVGRGYGLAKLFVNLVDIDKLQLPDKDLDFREKEKIVVYFASPSVNLDFYPRPFLSRDNMIIKIFGVKTIALNINTVLGKTMDTIYSWSYRTSTPKLPMKTLAPGSLAIATIDHVYDKNMIKFIPVAGCDHLSSQGYNIVILTRKDFVETYREENI